MKDEARLKQIVEPALGRRVRDTVRANSIHHPGWPACVGATTLDATGVRAIVSGGYEIVRPTRPISGADCLDGRASRRFNCSTVPRPTHSARSVDRAFLLAGGAGDRLRDPKARRHRTRRTAAAAAGADIAPPCAGAFGSNAAEPGTSASPAAMRGGLRRSKRLRRGRPPLSMRRPPRRRRQPSRGRLRHCRRRST